MSIIPRLSLHHELVPLVRDMITEGELKPGDKIHEPQLCQRFGVSRTPLREALKVLAADGLVSITPNRGAVVSEISRDQINELFPIMGMLEALAGELATQKIKKREHKRLIEMHEQMLVHWRADEWAPYIRLNRMIHEMLFAIAGNESLTALYGTLMVRIHSVRYTAKKSQARWDEAVSEHQALMDAIALGDSAKAGAILRLHLKHKAEMVHEALDAQARTPDLSKETVGA